MHRNTRQTVARSFLRSPFCENMTSQEEEQLIARGYAAFREAAPDPGEAIAATLKLIQKACEISKLDNATPHPSQ